MLGVTSLKGLLGKPEFILELSELLLLGEAAIGGELAEASAPPAPIWSLISARRALSSPPT